MQSIVQTGACSLYVLRHVLLDSALSLKIQNGVQQVFQELQHAAEASGS